MRTTIRLDDAILRQAKARAAATGRSLNDFISDAVRAALVPPRRSALAVDLPTDPGGLLLPGVDLDDSASLLELMEGRAGPLPDSISSASSPRRVAERSTRRQK
jgi:plasmid stability protein